MAVLVITRWYMGFTWDLMGDLTTINGDFSWFNMVQQWVNWWIMVWRPVAWSSCVAAVAFWKNLTTAAWLWHGSITWLMKRKWALVMPGLLLINLRVIVPKGWYIYGKYQYTIDIPKKSPINGWVKKGANRHRKPCSNAKKSHGQSNDWFDLLIWIGRVSPENKNIYHAFRISHQLRITPPYGGEWMVWLILSNPITQYENPVDPAINKIDFHWGYTLVI